MDFERLRSELLAKRKFLRRKISESRIKMAHSGVNAVIGLPLALKCLGEKVV